MLQAKSEKDQSHRDDNSMKFLGNGITLTQRQVSDEVAGMGREEDIQCLLYHASESPTSFQQDNINEPVF